MVEVLGILIKETAWTEEEVAEGLMAEPWMGIEELEEINSEKEEEDEGTQRALGALEFLTQDAEPSGTTIVDACNGFNKMSRLTML